MVREDLPFVIVGMTVAGVAAALELASQGVPVRLIPDYVGIHIDDCYEIGETPLNSHPIGGHDFEQLASRRFQAEGVVVESYIWVDGPALDPVTQGLVIRGWSNHEDDLSARGIVYAVNGQYSKPPATLECEGLLGRGIGWSASSDLYMARGCPALILGSGYFAVEQAMIAMGAASTVTIVSEAPEYPNPRGLRRLAEEAEIRVLRGAAFRRLVVREDRVVVGLVVAIEGREKTLDSAWIFLADEPLAPWGGEHDAWWQLGTEWVARAGAARGVPHWDHAAQWESGVRAARELLGRTSAGGAPI